MAHRLMARDDKFRVLRVELIISLEVHKTIISTNGKLKYESLLKYSKVSAWLSSNNRDIVDSTSRTIYYIVMHNIHIGVIYWNRG